MTSDGAAGGRGVSLRVVPAGMVSVPGEWKLVEGQYDDVASWTDREVRGGIGVDGHPFAAHVAHFGEDGAQVWGARELDGSEALRSSRSRRREHVGDGGALRSGDQRDLVGRRGEVRATVEGVDAMGVAKADALQEFLDPPRLEPDLADHALRCLWKHARVHDAVGEETLDELLVLFGKEIGFRIG